MNALELEDIKMQFNQKVLFENLDLAIEKGTINTIMGESGSGKSTLLNIIGLLLKPTAGAINILDYQNVKPNTRQAMLILRNDISYIFQNYALIENDTVKENLLLSKKYRKDFKEKELGESLEKVGISKEYLGHKVCELSGGEQQRIAIARTMLKPCEIILADEPTGNLDTSNKEKIIHLFKELKKEGKTIVCVTHDEEMAKSADRIIDLKKERGREK